MVTWMNPGPNMPADFFGQPILNSPYAYPSRHWQLDADGQPTQNIVLSRRPASFVTPIPKSKKQATKKGKGKNQKELVLDEGHGLSTEHQAYDTTPFINEIRVHVHRWRQFASPADWKVTPETARLIQHWRTHPFQAQRPFFCQVEAAETAIWLAEVAPKTAEGKKILSVLEDANLEANPELFRIALKLATGAGKTTVMAMLIAWQTINAVRHPGSKLFTSGFVLVAPGLTIKDRLRVLQPNDPDNYYTNREIVPADMQGEIRRARIVITNYHAFKLRETMELSAGNRALLQGPTGEPISTKESEGQMLQRVMPELMGLKNIIVINDEAHHCYREKPEEASDEPEISSEEKKEAEKNNEAARLWISGIEGIKKTIGVSRVYDLSATPFFLRGSGYAEGTLFPWTACDFSLMDAIECGIVKLPRVPVVDNLPSTDMPTFRNLWENIKKDMPKKGRGKGQVNDPSMLPPKLQSALDALYGHYKKTYDVWLERGVKVPPCFIVVCQNTAISELVYKYISGYMAPDPSGDEDSGQFKAGKLELFRNYDSSGNALNRPNTLLIDSLQLESGDAIEPGFRQAFAAEIDLFRRDKVERSGDIRAGENLSDADLLREVMNTVGKSGTLGGNIRCVVSVSMLTEGWDANTVTHVLGVRAFGTQLLCEQVIGRALRRQSYELNAEGLFTVEYADVFGIPFDFNAKPAIAPVKAPLETIRVHAVRPERDALEIRFPRVQGYRIDLPAEEVHCEFGPDHVMELNPSVVGPSETHSSGIIGMGADFNLKHLAEIRTSSVIYNITQRLIDTKFRDPNGAPKMGLFGKLKNITAKWIDSSLKCVGGTFPAQLMYAQLADMACEKIMAAITLSHLEDTPVKAILDPYNPTGSTSHVRFNTTKDSRFETHPLKSHINYVMLDSDWEAEFCRVAESHPQVVCYVKNQGLGFEVPYRYGPEVRAYLPDFIVRIDDGHGPDDLLNLVIEVKGYRREDASEKKNFMESYWIPGVNHIATHGRWAFAEFREVFAMEAEFAAKVRQEFEIALKKAGVAEEGTGHGQK